MPAVTRQLPFPATYPSGRQAFFAMRYQAHLFNSESAIELGSDVLVLLMLISAAEDRAWYRRPVQFWNSTLMTKSGMTRKRLFAARTKAVKAGWLSYSEGARSRAAEYFVTVPGGDAVINAAPIDDVLRQAGLTEQLGAVSAPGSELGPISAPNRGPIGDSFGDQSGSQSGTPSTLSPHPKPLPPSPSLGREEDLTSSLRKLLHQLRELEVSRAFLGLTEALRLVTEAQLTAVIAQALQRPVVLSDGRIRRPWGGGAVYRRITDPDLANLHPDRGWPKEDEAWRLAFEKSERERVERERADQVRQQQQLDAIAKERERDGLQQLEFQWGSLVDRVAAEEGGTERLLAIIRQRMGEIGEKTARRSGREFHRRPSFRRALLQAAAEGLMGGVS